MTCRYFYDTEFLEDGHTIELVSLGIVDETGERAYYAVSTEFDAALAGAWVRRNVLDKLPSPADPAWKSRRMIRDEVTAFLTVDANLNCGPGWAPTTTWCSASCTGRCPTAPGFAALHP